MLLIYTRAQTPRLNFILDFFFKELFGIEYGLTTDTVAFRKSDLPKLNYSEEEFDDEPFIYSSRLLFEKGIRQQDISVFDWENSKAFFATHPRYSFPFDPFAASFYLITRYEEYLPHETDSLGRYDVKNSLAAQKNFLQQPVVDTWANALKSILQKKYPALKFKERKYRHISTIDIDNAYAFREKGVVRTTGALLRSAMNRSGKEIVERLSVVLGSRSDPYDTYEELFRIQQSHNLKCIYFFLVGDYSDNDKNISYRSKQFQSLIKYIADYNEVGIHPSFASNNTKEAVGKEKARLEKITRRIINKSRQHFLMLKFPETYRNLLEFDLTDDYSMGYAGDVGFRAGTCSSFYFYDIDREVKTKLKIHPFAVMDATLLYYLKLQPDQCTNVIKSLVEEVKAVNGTFISLWHNESLSDIPPWQGWRSLYEQMVDLAK